MKVSLFQGILLGVCGAAALVGLFVFATYTGSNSGSSGIGKVVIWGELPQQQMQGVLTQLTQNDQSLKDVSYVEKDPADFESDLVSAIAAGQGPDLVLMSQEDLVPLMSVIQTIPSSSLSASEFTSSFTGGASIWEAPGNAGAYGIPYLIDPLVLYANGPMLSSDGIAQVPSTWDALTGLVPKVTSEGVNDSITHGLIALGEYSNVNDARAILSALFFQAGVPITSWQSTGILAPNLGLEATDNGVQAGPAVVNFYAQFADPSKTSYTWNSGFPNSEQAFAAGDIALYLGFASEASYFTQANPNLDLSTSPLPQPATATTKVTYGKIYAFAIPRGSANPTGALAAATALLGSAADADAASATGLAPALRSLLATTPNSPTDAIAYQSALYAQGWLSPAAPSVDQVFSVMITSVTSGTLSASAALANAQSALGALVQ